MARESASRHTLMIITIRVMWILVMSIKITVILTITGLRWLIVLITDPLIELKLNNSVVNINSDLKIMMEAHTVVRTLGVYIIHVLVQEIFWKSWHVLNAQDSRLPSRKRILMLRAFTRWHEISWRKITLTYYFIMSICMVSELWYLECCEILEIFEKTIGKSSLSIQWGR